MKWFRLLNSFQTSKCYYFERCLVVYKVTLLGKLSQVTSNEQKPVFKVDMDGTLCWGERKPLDFNLICFSQKTQYNVIYIHT